MGPTEPAMFESVYLPAIRKKKFEKFLKFVGENRDLIAMTQQKEMIIDGKALEGSKLDDVISKYLCSKHYV